MDVLAYTCAFLLQTVTDWRCQKTQKSHPILIHSSFFFFPICTAPHTPTHAHTQIYTHPYAQVRGLWDTGNDNRGMLICANDAVISWRVQMEREINNGATGNEVL